MTGGDVGLGALAGGIGGAIGGAVGFKTLKWDLPGRVAAQVISGSVSGGIASVINGGNFWQGMAWGAAGAAIASGIGAVIEIATDTESEFGEPAASSAISADDHTRLLELQKYAHELAQSVQDGKMSSLDALVKFTERVASYHGNANPNGVIGDLALVLGGIDFAGRANTTYYVDGFGASGFKLRFVDTSNQVRHTVGATLAGYRYGLRGIAYMQWRELRSPDGARTMADFRLNRAAGSIGRSLARGSLRVDQLAARYRTVLGQ